MLMGEFAAYAMDFAVVPKSEMDLGGASDAAGLNSIER